MTTPLAGLRVVELCNGITNAQTAQMLFQQPLGIRLRQHQRIRICALNPPGLRIFRPWLTPCGA